MTSAARRRRDISVSPSIMASTPNARSQPNAVATDTALAPVPACSYPFVHRLPIVPRLARDPDSAVLGHQRIHQIRRNRAAMTVLKHQLSVRTCTRKRGREHQFHVALSALHLVDRA